MRPVETIHADRDKDDLLTGFQRWLLRGISAIPDPTRIGTVILATRDASGLMKEMYARVCIRDAVARAEYSRVTNEVSFWIERVRPSYAVREGCILFVAHNG